MLFAPPSSEPFIASGSVTEFFNFYDGAWPYSKATSRDNYFLHDYPVVCQTIEELALSQNER